MTPDPKSRTMSWTLGVIAALLLYVLSIGPVAGWLLANGTPSPPTWYAILYAPHGWAYDHNRPVQRLLDEYMDWWIKFFEKRKAKGLPTP